MWLVRSRVSTLKCSFRGVSHSLELLEIDGRLAKVQSVFCSSDEKLNKKNQEKSSFPIDFISSVRVWLLFFVYYVCWCPFCRRLLLSKGRLFDFVFSFSFQFNYFICRILTFIFIHFYSNILLWFILLFFFSYIRVQMCDNAELVNIYLLMVNKSNSLTQNNQITPNKMSTKQWNCSQFYYSSIIRMSYDHNIK